MTLFFKLSRFTYTLFSMLWRLFVTWDFSTESCFPQCVPALDKRKRPEFKMSMYFCTFQHFDAMPSSCQRTIQVAHEATDVLRAEPTFPIYWELVRRDAWLTSAIQLKVNVFTFNVDGLSIWFYFCWASIAKRIGQKLNKGSFK